MRAVVHIAGRPDPDGFQRCVICRHQLADSSSGGAWLMGRDISQIISHDSTLRHESGSGPAETLSIRCTALG